MCRHLAYLGEPCAPAGPVLRAAHALLVQAYAPRDMRGGGTVNADGFGVGWFAGDGSPVRYRRAGPLWSDETVGRLTETTSASAFAAAVRSGTPGMPVAEAACAPFADEHWLFSHNGVVRGWPRSVAGVTEKLPVAELMCLEAPTDSAWLWALLAQRLRRGADPVSAIGELVCEVASAAPGSRLNLLLVGPEVLVATAWTHALWVRADDTGTLVASEPTEDDPAWQPVPDGCLVTARRHDPAAVEVVDLDRGEGGPGGRDTGSRGGWRQA